MASWRRVALSEGLKWATALKQRDPVRLAFQTLVQGDYVISRWLRLFVLCVLPLCLLSCKGQPERLDVAIAI